MQEVDRHLPPPARMSVEAISRRISRHRTFARWSAVVSVAAVASSVVVLIGAIRPNGYAGDLGPTTTTITAATVTTAEAATTTTTPVRTTMAVDSYESTTPMTVPSPPVSMYRLAGKVGVGWLTDGNRTMFCWETDGTDGEVHCTDDRPEALAVHVGDTIYVIVASEERPPAVVTVTWADSTVEQQPVVWDDQVALGVASFTQRGDVAAAEVDPPMPPPPSW
jgi:hypothetical protein